VYRRWEREAADPAHATKNSATLSAAVKAFLEEQQELVDVGKIAEATAAFYKEKCGTLIRLLEVDERGGYQAALLAELFGSAATGDRYVSQRRKEWSVLPKAEVKGRAGNVIRPPVPGRRVSEHTIAKELTVLRMVLGKAKRLGWWSGDLEEVAPSVGSGYKPRKRALSVDEVSSLLRPAVGVPILLPQLAGTAGPVNAFNHGVTSIVSGMPRRDSRRWPYRPRAARTSCSLGPSLPL
jgi:hypothetical protein